MTASLLATCCLLWQLSAASPVRADDIPPKRALPDYDGRPETTSAGEALLWIPRVLLSPLYLVTEYGIRRPLGFLVSAAERAQLPEAIIDLFLFGPNHSAGILPIAFVDFGFYPSVGLYFFWNDFLPKQDLKLRGATWGEHWLSGAISDRIHLDSRVDLFFEASGIRRPDYQFYGLGSDSLRRDRSRYGASHLSGSAGLEMKLGALSRLTSSVGIRRVHFHRGGFGDDPRLDQAVADGRYPLPDGYAQGYTLLFDQLSLAIDTRKPRPEPGSGVRIEAHAEQLNQLEPPLGFVRYGASVGGFLDLAQRGRVVSLSFAAQFIDPLREAPIPFTELITIGGGELMRGFPPGRLYGRSAAVATLRYRWPVWVWLDGSIQVACGNVFDKHLENFSPERLRLSAALGVESVGSPDSSLELLIGIGSETFQHGTQITSLRVAFGTNHGF